MTINMLSDFDHVLFNFVKHESISFMDMVDIGLNLLLEEVIDASAFLRIPVPQLVDILEHIFSLGISIDEPGLEPAEVALKLSLPHEPVSDF